MPGAGVIRGGIFGEETVNAGAFHFVTNTTEKKSAHVIVDDVSRVMTSSNFTFETFYRWKETHSSGSAYIFGEHGQKGQAIIGAMNAAGRISISVQAKASSNLVDSTTGEATGTVYYAVTKSLGSHYGLVDDKWHHFALVRDFDAQTVKLYIDYVLAGSQEDVAELYVLPVSGVGGGNTYNNNFHIGSAYGAGSAYQTNNGYLDEVRITKRALLPQEFLMRDEQPDFTTNTVAWYTFEEDYMPEPRSESRQVTTVGTCSRETEVPGGKGTIIVDGYGNELRDSNEYSLKITNGKTALTWVRDLPLENHDEVTVEFFARGTACTKYRNVVALYGSQGSDDTRTGCVIWAVQTANDDLRYRTSFATASTADGGYAMTGTTVTEDGEADPVACDGKWHHIAATFKKEGTKTRETFYCDYKEICSKAAGNNLRTNLVDSSLLIGGGITGWIDEIRISKGVLPIEAFLRRKTLGLTLIIR